MEQNYNLQSLDRFLKTWLSNPHLEELLQDGIKDALDNNHCKPEQGKVDITHYANTIVLNELITRNLHLTTNIVALHDAARRLLDTFVRDYLGAQHHQLDGLPAGQHFLYNDIEFVKLGDEQDGILCVTAQPWTSIPFDKAEHNNFATSSVLDVLNSSFLSQLGDKDLLLYEIDLTADNGDRSYGSAFVQVGLLSANLYRKYRDYIPQYTTSVMTCTPSYCGDTVDYIRCIGPGRVLADYTTGFDWGVVPAVIFSKNTVVRLKNL